MLSTLFSKLAYQIFTMLIALMYSITPYTAPKTDAPIAPKDPDNVKMYFAAIADPQVSNYLLQRVPTFDAACEDLHNAAYPMDAIVTAGDITENGLSIEYQYVYEKLGGIETKYINAEGNHDIRLRNYEQGLSRFSTFTNQLNNKKNYDSYHYTIDVKGYKFIILGADRAEFEESYLTDAQLEWLDALLTTQAGHPTFVVIHQPLKGTHGLPGTWGSPLPYAGSVGAQSDKLNAVLQKYTNVMLITGHLHTGFGQYTYEKNGNLHMINLPSLCVQNKQGENNDGGLGCMVLCYENEIVFRARNFAKGEWLPDFDIHVPVDTAA